MHKEPIFFDCDGILFDFVTPFLKWCYNTNKCGPSVKRQIAWGDNAAPCCWDFEGYNFEGIDWCRPNPNLDQYFREFWETGDFAQLPSTVLITHLEMLRLSGHKLYAITSLTKDWLPRYNRLHNITNKYPGIFERVFFTGGERKYITLSQFAAANKEPRVILIDDNPDECIGAYLHTVSVQPILIADAELSPFLQNQHDAASRLYPNMNVAPSVSQAILLTIMDDELPAG